MLDDAEVRVNGLGADLSGQMEKFLSGHFGGVGGCFV